MDNLAEKLSIIEANLPVDSRYPTETPVKTAPKPPVSPAPIKVESKLPSLFKTESEHSVSVNSETEPSASETKPSILISQYNPYQKEQYKKIATEIASLLKRKGEEKQREKGGRQRPSRTVHFDPNLPTVKEEMTDLIHQERGKGNSQPEIRSTKLIGCPDEENKPEGRVNIFSQMPSDWKFKDRVARDLAS